MYWHCQMSVREAPLHPAWHLGGGEGRGGGKQVKGGRGGWRRGEGIGGRGRREEGEGGGRGRREREEGEREERMEKKRERGNVKNENVKKIRPEDDHPTTNHNDNLTRPYSYF